MRKLLALGVLILGVAAPVHSYITKKDILIGGSIAQVKWAGSSPSITWALNPTQGSNITGARSLSTVMQASFDTWDAVTTANFAFARGADAPSATIHDDDNINLIKMNLTPAVYVTVAGDALAVTLTSYDLVNGALLDTDIIFDPTISFSTDTTPPANRFDLQSVATHEVGHLLGLDHSAILSATMFPRIDIGASAPRVLSSDDIAGISAVYPTAVSSKGSISGTVRLTSNAMVYGALVVAVNSDGQPVAHGVSDTKGNYVINGLDPGTYTIYAEPMDSPYFFADQSVLDRIYPGSTISTLFTTRFR